VTDVALPTRKRGDSLIFDATLDITVDRNGTPTAIDDLTGWDPICQFARTPGDDDRIDLTLLNVTGKTVTFGIPNATAALMADDYKGEIVLQDPEAPAGFGEMRWPGAGSYLTYTAAQNVAVRDS
jgi:hypothetical protein